MGRKSVQHDGIVTQNTAVGEGVNKQKTEIGGYFTTGTETGIMNRRAMNSHVLPGNTIVYQTSIRERLSTVPSNFSWKRL